MTTNLRIASVNAKKSAGNISINLLVSAVLGLLVIFYIMQSNALISQDYRLRQAQYTLKDLEDEGKKLNFEILKIKSSQNLLDNSSKIQLVPAGKVSYLRDAASGVVQK